MTTARNGVRFTIAIGLLTSLVAACSLTARQAGGEIEPSHEPGVWQPLRDTFWQRAGRVGNLPPAPARVRVAVLDTASSRYDEASGNDSDGHGRLVGRAIDDLTCPARFGQGQGCVAEIANYLALPRASASAGDETWGSSYGSPAEVAAAVERALAAWQRDRQHHGGPEKLVLNLSLGGPAKAFDDETTAPLLAALRRAACLDVPIIVPAGNAETAGAEGLLLPAAWQSVVAPSDDACRSAGWPVAARSHQGPLVYAVGAVDQFDRPLTTTRLGAMPVLAAYGLAVVTRDPRAPPGVTRAASGTSMAAAVVTAAVAVAWANRPDLDAAQLMQGVTDSALPIATSATSSRRVSVCATLRWARADPAPCPVLEDERSPLVALDPSAFQRVRLEAKRLMDCREGRCMAEPDAEPWLLPQPSGGGCSTCAIQPRQGQLLVALSRAQAACTRRLILTLELEAGEVTYEIPAPIGAAEGYPPSFTAMLPDSLLVQRAKSATLTAIVHGNNGRERMVRTSLPVLR